MRQNSVLSDNFNLIQMANSYQRACFILNNYFYDLKLADSATDPNVSKVDKLLKLFELKIFLKIADEFKLNLDNTFQTGKPKLTICF